MIFCQRIEDFIHDYVDKNKKSDTVVEWYSCVVVLIL